SLTYYSVLLLEGRLQDLQSLADLLGDRIKELRQRVRLGKSRDSEAVTVESELAGVEAQMEGVKGQAAVARQDLSYLVDADLTQSQLADPFPPITSTPALADELVKAENRSDIQA